MTGLGQHAAYSAHSEAVLHVGAQFIHLCRGIERYHLDRGQGGPSLAVQWLRLCASTAGGTGLIPGGTETLNKKERAQGILTW